MTGFDFPRTVSGSQELAHRVEVCLEIGVRPAELASVRVVAADLAARADFDLDAVSDLRMAVDEACSTLATLAPQGARLRCMVQVAPDRITVTAQVPEPRSQAIRRDTFGWRVLETLTDQVEVLVADRQLGIRLVKTRRPGMG